MCLVVFKDESDEDDDSRPARKRRLAERAAEGMEVEDEQVLENFISKGCSDFSYLFFGRQLNPLKTWRTCRVTL